ncbi:Rieske [2Fe-2S] domain protein [Aspergillus japonicus CBS 114.51]|uniref:Rieske [2Fe-2S] domain protein n=1 Tax=Aspergillus japonicus CBS 114.51 TaxID=1448312 RepID=A0A8T8WTZ8_ASPJA|nr:Rieske [2Fe-2S] domain protein [Aspergillus japonicus CBS 114.51]RAH79130.1 Rieske [2Fe-2S] domain protein [Aspergillus japonicus CBS 114.51]
MNMNPFHRPAQTAATWRKVGLTSDFPDVDSEEAKSRIKASCKAFHVPTTAPTDECPSDTPVEADLDMPGNINEQVLVFRYKGKFHAIDHQCPHALYPLSWGSVFDIEDFGITLSAGINCPKHGWSFDLFSGQADRGNYKLKVWEVQLRDPPASQGGAAGSVEQEVWVRRKQRIG